MALLAGARSPCERLHVGCVLVKDKRVLSMGYNGFFSGAPHESIMAGGHEQATVHAEQNAISHAARTGIALLGAVAYVTHYPCVNCFKSLVAAGIEHVYYIDDYRNDAVNAQLSRVSGISIEQLVEPIEPIIPVPHTPAIEQLPAAEEKRSAAPTPYATAADGA
ncbi:cytidine deaminase-like protein [Pelagophyceae sp. CCMP2097]|nr:cytidine deaminase-like protein [Pelagophyceae sp. CCMP2097]